jgi:hypothetical protein
MTQKQRVLNALKAAGGVGIRSDVFIRDFMPRAAARIQELKDEGWDISSERDGKFVVWRLENVGSSTEGRDQAGTSIPQPVDTTLGVASGVEHLSASSPHSGASGAPPATRNPYECEVWEEAA